MTRGENCKDRERERGARNLRKPLRAQMSIEFKLDFQFCMQTGWLY